MSDYDFSVDDILAEFYKDIEPEIKEEDKAPKAAPAVERKTAAQSNTPVYSERQYVNEDKIQRVEEKTPLSAPTHERTINTERDNINAAYEAYMKKSARKDADVPSYDNPYANFAKSRFEDEKPAPVKKTETVNEEVIKRTKRPPYFEEGTVASSKSETVRRQIETYKRENFIDDEDYQVDKEDPRFSAYHDDEDVFDSSRGRIPVYAGKKRDNTKKAVRGFLAGIFIMVSSLVLIWVGLYVHPESETMTFSKTGGKTDLISRLDTYSNNSKVDVLSTVEEIAEKAQIKKVYKIPEDQKVAPTPNKAYYGTSPINDTTNVMEAVNKAEASGLLDGQDLIFSPDVSFYYDSDIQYYYDETILVICWKQLVEGRVTSFCEVKIADASQIRRKLCEDTYGSSVYLYCSELAEQANAVVAMNSDYYAFRDLGITCYDRTVYRFNEYSYYGYYKAYNVTDTLFIDENGDFVFFYRGRESTKDEVQQWVNDNNLLYSIAFGPILVDNYNLVEITDYPVGEINTEYSRAGLAQCGNLHYLYMAVSHSNDGTPRCTVPEFAQMFYNLGVQNAYCFDGGQTGELYFNGEPYNHIDFGNERTVSDIIYFATAIGTEGTQ